MHIWLSVWLAGASWQVVGGPQELQAGKLKGYVAPAGGNVTFTVEGPTATKYLSEEQLKQVKIVDRTPGVPTHLVCVREGLSTQLTDKIKAALLKASASHPELLADVYGAKALVEVDENSHVQKAVDAIEATGLPVEGLAK